MPRSKGDTKIRSTADLARYVGLARTTVSRVLNGHPGIKPKTVEQVRRAIEETGFTLNAAAKRLRGKGDRTIGICMETLFTPPMVSKLGLLQRRLREREVISLIEVVDHGKLDRVVQHFRSMQTAGVVFIGQFDPAEVEREVRMLRRHGMFHLLIDQVGVPGANSVSLDRAGAMRACVNHLVDLGHRRFGLVGLDKPFESIRMRVAGIAESLAARGLDLARDTVSLDYLVPRDQNFAFGRAMAEAFARRVDRPTAFLCVNDEVAAGLVVAFQELGLKVPDEVSVIGFNNQDVCQVCAPHLTTIDQEIEATIDSALELVMGQFLERSATATVRMIPARLVQRASTGTALLG